MENLAGQTRTRESHTFMNPIIVTEDTFNRLAKAIMLRHSVGYLEALAILHRLRLNLICQLEIAHSPSLQAALLTAVNAGKRAFHGGVFVSMPADVPCLLNWPGKATLNDIVRSLGGSFVGPADSPFTHTIYFGHQANPVPDALAVVCSGWRGGVTPADMPLTLSSPHDFALGGIAAGALGIAHGFLRVSGLSYHALTQPHGISLWRPDLPWTVAEAEGPLLELLPKSVWMLGLGHLGQGYLWSLGLLPYAASEEVSFLLQDFDRAVNGNRVSGLLCEADNIGKPKTRMCASWLEARGFQTVITERPFDSNTKRSGTEPFVACCGFDSAEPRRLLEGAGFDLIVECALGGDTATFDRVVLHTFPDATRKPQEIWGSDDKHQPEAKIIEALKTQDDCGILAETLARKAISSSFVGAFAGALLTGELLRALHGGVRCELIQMHLRHSEVPGVVLRPESFLLKIARSGYTSARIAEAKAA